MSAGGQKQKQRQSSSAAKRTYLSRRALMLAAFRYPSTAAPKICWRRVVWVPPHLAMAQHLRWAACCGDGAFGKWRRWAPSTKHLVLGPPLPAQAPRIEPRWGNAVPLFEKAHPSSGRNSAVPDNSSIKMTAIPEDRSPPLPPPADRPPPSLGARLAQTSRPRLRAIPAPPLPGACHRESNE